MPTTLAKFWRWYGRHYQIHLIASALLFLLQILHLTWLTLHVVLFRLAGHSYWSPAPFLQYALIAVDYTEIPALVSTSLLYLYEMRHQWQWKGIAFLLFLNTQWLHLFWITDEFVISQFTAAPGTTVLPVWLAWVAICIDFLELPVIFDTVRKATRSLLV